MIPEIYTIIIILLVFAALYGIVVWLSMVLQSLIFQKYRMNKNEAAMRKTRLYEKEKEKESYHRDLLGEVKDANSSSE